jgi:outer membrane protein OmpU
MINLKKIGATALAGSLVAMSAYAGEMAVTGSAAVTYKTGKNGTGDQGSFGNNSALSFNGTGELDNGWSFVMSVNTTDGFGAMSTGTNTNDAITSSYTSLTMGSMGTLSTGFGIGGAGSKYDEEVPQAYEQVSDGNSFASSNKIGDQMDNGGILYNSPSFDIGGASVSFDAEYNPQADDSVPATDGGQVTYSATDGEGYGLGVTAKYENATIGVYGNEVESRVTKTAIIQPRDTFEGVVYAKYAMGPLAFGVSRSHIDSATSTGGVGINENKTLRTSGGIFTNDQMSVAYNVNDDLSVSFTRSVDTYEGRTDIILTSGVGVNESIDMTVNAYQAAYSMGAMSIKAYNMNVKNPGYNKNAQDRSITEIAVGLAF